MSLSPDEFREALGRFASGVTVVTARDAAGIDHGMTVSSFCSVSLVPPLVLACIAQVATMHRVLHDAPVFGISVLAASQEPLSRHFAEIPEQRFDGIGFSRGASGVILLDDAHAHLECRRVAWHAAGDHGICVGEVERSVLFNGRPLLYYRGGYTRLEG